MWQETGYIYLHWIKLRKKFFYFTRGLYKKKYIAYKK